MSDKFWQCLKCGTVHDRSVMICPCFELNSLHEENSALRSQVAAALAADGQWMEQTGELRKQVARLRSLLARYREHIMEVDGIDYLGHCTGMPPITLLPAKLAISADEADEIRAIGIEEICDQILRKD